MSKTPIRKPALPTRPGSYTRDAKGALTLREATGRTPPASDPETED